MADEDIVAPVVEEVVAELELPLVEGETIEKAEADKPAEEAKPAEEPAVVVDEQPDLPKWVKIELSKRADKISAGRQALAEKDAEIERLKLAQGDPSKLPGDYVPKSQVSALVQQAKEEERYIENCNAANESGRKAYKDWPEAVDMLQSLGGFDIPTMRGIMATGAGDKALYQLGKNPDEYHRIMELPFERRIVEITKLTERAAITPKPVSQAPAPIRTVGGTAAPSKNLEITDNMDDDKAYAVLQERRRLRVASRR